MVAQTHPFKPIPEKLDMPWEGVHQSHPLRDDPDHPHSLFGEGHKNTFHQGGLIPGAVGFDAAQKALSGTAQPLPAPVIPPAALAPPVTALPAQVAALQQRQGVLSRQPPGRSRREPAARSRGNFDTQALTDGGKVKGKKKATKQTSGTKDLTAKTATARLKGRALQIENAERAAEGLPPLEPAKK